MGEVWQQGPEQEPGRTHLQLAWKGSKESELEVGRGSKLSMPTPSEVLPPATSARYWSQNLPRGITIWGRGVQAPELTGRAFLIQTTTLGL